MRKVWFNGNIVPESEAKLSIYDSALMYADMPFEMFRSFNKNVFKFNEHLERLKMSCKILEIDIPYEWSHLRGCYEGLVDANVWNKDDEIRGLINISRGILPMYADAGMGESITNIIIACFPLRYVLKDKSKVYTEGIDVIVSFQMAISETFLDAKIKSRSRQHYKLADLEVHRYNPGAWALLLDNDGFVAEGTGSNFFIVKDEKIITPEGRNILRGISRAYIFELAKQLRLECIEKNIEPFDVYEADEAFITATPFCILPVATLNKRIIGKQFRIVINRIVINNLIYQWSENVGVDIVKQIKEWDKENKKEECTSPYQFKG